MNGWDAPVIFAWNIKKQLLKTHSTLNDGTRVSVHKMQRDTVWDVRHRVTSIWVHIIGWNISNRTPLVLYDAKANWSLASSSQAKQNDSRVNSLYFLSTEA